MMSSSTPRRSVGHIEPLEARIAPATILIGARGFQEENRNDTEYVDHNANLREGKTAAHGDIPAHADFGALNFVNIMDGSVNGGPANLNDPIAKALRGDIGAVGGSTALETSNPNRYFYLRLHAGDSVVTFPYHPDNPLISVTYGDAIAVFTDFVTGGASENDYDTGEFTGLILGPGAKVEIHGAVYGDIVTALDTHKTANTADDTLDFSGLVSSKQNLGNVKVLGGAVFGSVFSGGSIDNLTISGGSVENVLAGTAVNGHKFDLVQSPLFLNGRFTPDVSANYGAGVAGANINNAFLHDVFERVEAGAGGFGAKGGSLNNITVNADTDGFAIIAGHGGNVDATHKTGGAGGSLTKINVQGTPDMTPNSVGTASILVQGVAKTINGVMLVAGDGGGTLGLNAALRGGAGGSVTGVTAGIVGVLVANDLSEDSFHVYGGVGGTGKTGGLGGSITNANVVVSTQDAAGNEIEFIAGAGGTGGSATSAGGVAGVGGSLTSIKATNNFYSFDPTVSAHSSTLLRAGDAGSNDALSTGVAGAAGGSIKTVTLVGFDSDVTAGSGSSGVSGGKGGSVTTLTYPANQTIITHNVVVNAGKGGDGSKGAGGAGGAITGVKAGLADLENFYLNAGVGAAAGGTSLTGRGGAGGAVSGVDVVDVDKSALNTNFLNGDVRIYGGVGGNGGAGGGAGGALNTLHVEGDHFEVDAQGGKGGDATTKGSGGAGGLVNGAFFKSSGSLNGVDLNGNPFVFDPSSQVLGGTGGNGGGAGGRGGAGGDLRGVSSVNDGDGTLQAGFGGNGQNTVGAVKGGAAGKGGSITSSGLIAVYGAGALIAGDAGVNGAAAAAGGSVIGSSSSIINGVRAAYDVTIKGGKGSHGGAGGDISTLGFSSSFFGFGFAPLGKVLVQAGDGSGEGAVAGRGGNVSGVTGVASELVDGTITTKIVAGAGGGGVGVKASGAGGSVSHSTIATGGGNGAIIVVEAGNAGNSTLAVTGGKGGGVLDVGISNLNPGTVIRSIAAGEGGIGTSKGGAGGSIDQIFTPNNDIGYRTGKAFGYSVQGGLFAGAGGVGGKSNGTNGSVTNVVATSISSIVAGARNNPIPHLAEKVANVSVNGTSSQLLLGRNDIFVPDGDFVLAFKGESTGLIPGHSTNVTIQTELNKLQSIIDAGGVQVLYTPNGGYSIKFNNKGAQPNIDAIEVVTRDVVEQIPNSSQAIPFATSVDGAAALPNFASEPGVAGFAAAITLNGSNVFRATEVVGGSANTGALEVEKIDVASAGTSPGAQFTLSFIGETTAKIFVGSSASTVEAELNKLNSVQNFGTVAVTKSGSVYTIEFQTAGRAPLIAGQAFLPEVQRLDLTSVHSAPNSTFTLSFNGQTTAPIPYGATATVVQQELVKLGTIKATNPNLTGGVAVTFVSPNVYDITFSENGFQSAITGSATISEVQTIHVVGGANDSFTITSGDQVTTPLAVGSTAEQVQTALNKLPEIIRLGGVTVAKSGADYNVTFNGVGAQALLQPKLLQKEQQNINLASNSGTTTDYTIHSEYPVLVDEAFPGQTKFLTFPDGNALVYNLVPGDTTGRTAVVTAGNPNVSEVDKLFFGQSSTTTALQLGDLFILKYSDGTAAGSQSANTVVIPYDPNMTTLAPVVQAALNALPNLKQGVTVIKDPNTANQLLITYTAKSAQVLLQPETYTPNPHPGGFPLDITTAQPGGGNVSEIQRLDLDAVAGRGGFFSLTFAGLTTTIVPTSNTVLTSAIANALNNLSTIGDFGGVNVTEVTPRSNIFAIQFQSSGDAPQITGLGIVPETEEINISSLAIDATDEFTLTFRGDSTPVFKQNTNAAQIQAELNKLPSIKALSSISNKPGTVKVFSTGPGLYRIDFPLYSAANGIGPDLVEPDLQNIVISHGGDVTHEVQHIDLRSLTAYANGVFTLDFGGETTTPLHQDATAQDVENALNALSTIQQTREDVGLGFTGKVAVAKTAEGEFDVTFNRFGQKAAITGSGTVNSDRFPIVVTQTTDGAPAIINIGEQRSGAYTAQSVVEIAPGSANSPETQRIDLSSFNNAGLADFTVKFGSETTAPIAFTANGTAPDAATVEAAINKLTLPPGGVTVTGGNGVYDVHFVSNGDVAAFDVQARHPEVQQIDLGSLYASADGEYTLEFNGQKTANLPHDANAAQIQAALNTLPAVTLAGGAVVAQVGSTSQFTVTFGKLGDQPAIVASGGLTHEVQRINIGELAGRSDAQFKLSFNGETTGLLSANLSPAALAAEIQTALNALGTINDTRTDANNPDHTVSAVGQVTVTAGENGNFFVTFDARGDVPGITGYSVATQDRVIPVDTVKNGTLVPLAVSSVDGGTNIKEKQTIDLSVLSSTSPDFQLSFDNDVTDTISPYTTGLLTNAGSTAANAAAIETALNSLPSIAAAGGVTVTVNGANPSAVDIAFNVNGNQQSIAGAFGQHEIQTLDVRALEQFHLTTTTLVNGDNAIKEQQIVDLTGVRTDFTFEFGGDRSISIPVNASINQIENALNALPAIATAGGVTVTAAPNTLTADHLIKVTFNNPGDQNPISGTADSADGVYRLTFNGHTTNALKVGLIDPSGPTTNQIALMEALQDLPGIQALSGHDQGSVKVTLVNGVYQLDFQGLGDQSTLTAGGTFAYNPTVDIHRVTDGQASSQIPLPVFESTPGRVIGPVTSTTTPGALNANEIQQIDLSGEFQGGAATGFVTFNFNGDPNGAAAQVSTPNAAQNIQNALNSLPTIQAVGSVTVVETSVGSHLFNVTFSASGDQPSLTADDTFNPGSVTLSVLETTKGSAAVLEVQKLDLQSLPSQSFQLQFGGAVATVNLNGADQAANAAILDAALDGLVPGGVTVTSSAAPTGAGYGTFDISFNNAGDVAQVGATSFITTETAQGGGVTHEVQNIDVSALQTPQSAGVTFSLSYNGEVTAPLSRFATAADVATALNALPQFAPLASHVTVTGGNGVFNVQFADTVDHAGLILAQAGNQEVQHLDTSSLAGQGSPDFRLTFNNQQTGAIPTGASASQVESELNQLPTIQQAGGVTVTATNSPAGYDVKFNTFANEGPITGSVAVHEQLILDLHNLQNESGFITFTDGTTTSVAVDTGSSALAIQQAINSISGSQTIVTQIHPGVFQISYLNAGSPAKLQAYVSKDGNSVRIPVNATTAEVESALDNISVSDVSLTGANGFYAIDYSEIGDQVSLTGTANIHQQLRPDMFAGQGGFKILVGPANAQQSTVELPPGATADQIRLALNQLPYIQDLGGVRTVTVNPDSSFDVTFGGDYELPVVQFVARQNLLSNNVVETTMGDVNTREVQVLSYTVQGAFDAAKFANARLVGAIADFNEFDSNKFHFFDLTQPGAHLDGNGVPVDGNNVPLLPTVASIGNPFTEGDLPIDGIVMAKTIDPNTTNFVPEAALVANPDKNAVEKTIFFDNLNGRTIL